MKKKKSGFTLIELLATLVILAIVIGITVITIGDTFGKAKRKSEGVFAKTIEDALDMYVNSKEARKLTFDDPEFDCCVINKTHGSVGLQHYYYDNPRDAVTISKIIESEYTPLLESDFVNPANKDVSCNPNAVVEMYKDGDYIYYYRVKKKDLGCFLCNDDVKSYDNKCTDDDVITNLPANVDVSGPNCINSCKIK